MQSASKFASTFLLQFGFLICVLFNMQAVNAEGVFLEKQKSQYSLSDENLNRIKAEYQIKFGQKITMPSGSFQMNNPPSNPPENPPGNRTTNPWEKKRSAQAKAQLSQNVWATCRNYALHKRNRCYREGRDAYKCEQMYDARTQLCDNAP